MYKMNEDESIDEMFVRLTTIINGLKFLGKTYPNLDKVRKQLRCLPKAWRPKVIAIEEAETLATLGIDLLHGSLNVHEQVIMTELHLKKNKTVALKASRKVGNVFSQKGKAVSLKFSLEIDDEETNGYRF